jgi:hypothetical protein
MTTATAAILVVKSRNAALAVVTRQCCLAKTVVESFGTSCSPFVFSVLASLLLLPLSSLFSLSLLSVSLSQSLTSVYTGPFTV